MDLRRAAAYDNRRQMVTTLKTHLQFFLRHVLDDFPFLLSLLILYRCQDFSNFLFVLVK